MKNRIRTIALVGMTILGCTPIHNRGTKLQATNDMTDSVKFLSQYFASDSFLASLECGSGAPTDKPMAYNNKLVFPDKADSFVFEFDPTSNLMGETCLVLITATPKSNDANKIEWLAEKNGTAVSNLLFISEAAALTGSESEPLLNHKAAYYQTFKIRVDGNSHKATNDQQSAAGEGDVLLPSVNPTPLPSVNPTPLPSVNPTPLPHDNSTSSTTSDVPLCAHGSASDTDNDGWGYENGASCRVSASSNTQGAVPTCAQGSATDPDNDGWGYENGASCKVSN